MKVGVLLFLAVLLLLGWASHRDQVQEDRFYCEMVAEGKWPAYRGMEVCR